MKKWLIDRFKEPSTYAGLSSVMVGAGLLFDINEAPAISDTIGAAGSALASGDYKTGLAVVAMGLLSILLGEKSRK